MEWLRIGEVARRTGLTTRTLRHYDELGLLVPSGRTDVDYRMYTLDDVQRLLAIQHLKSLGLGLTEIGAALDDPGFDASATLRRHIEAVEDRIAAEQDLLRRLTSLVAAPHEDWDDVLAAIALSERLRHPEAAVRFRATLDAPADIPTPDLIELLRGDPEPGVREVATWALVQRGPAAFDAVSAHLADPDADVRRQMAHVLGKLADPRGVAPLAALLSDPAPEVAAKAAFALGQLGGPDAVAALAAALGRGAATQRATVVTALGRLGTHVSTPVDAEPADGAHPLGSAAAVAAVAALAAANPAARADAAEVLGLLDDPAALAALAVAASDPVEDVRLAALMALGTLPGAAPVLHRLAEAEGRAGALARALVSRLG